MKAPIVIICFVTVVFAIDSVGAGAEKSGLAETFSCSCDISAINRYGEDRIWLVLQKNHADFLTIPNTPQGITPQLQSAYEQDNQLAIVVDYDLSFQYQRYTFENGAWVMKEDVIFHSIGLIRRQKLISVKLIDLTHVKLTSIKPGDSMFREKRKVQPGDPEEIFDFSVHGEVRKNNRKYDFNGGKDGE